MTIDLDSTICETYGLAKEGPGHHGYTGQRGYHPLLAVAGRHRRRADGPAQGGPGSTARGAAHFLRETVDRCATPGQRTTSRCGLTAASTPTPSSPYAASRMSRFSITIRQHQSLRNLIESIPEESWTPIPYWMDGAADVAETSYTPFQGEPDAAPVRLIVGG